MPDVVNLSHAEIDSECSGADSGKGTSEEGDAANGWQQAHSPNTDQPPPAARPSTREYPPPAVESLHTKIVFE